MPTGSALPTALRQPLEPVVITPDGHCLGAMGQRHETMRLSKTKPFLYAFVPKEKLAREADAAEHLRLGCKDAGEQEEPFEQLLFAREGYGQQAGLEQNAVGETDGRLIGQDYFDGAGGGFSFPLDDAIDDDFMSSLLDRNRRVGDHSLEPADQVALLDGEFAADANGADPVHEVDGLTLLQSEEGLYVTATEERNGFGPPRFREDSCKLMNIRGVVGHGGNLEESIANLLLYCTIVQYRIISGA